MVKILYIQTYRFLLLTTLWMIFVNVLEALEKNMYLWQSVTGFFIYPLSSLLIVLFKQPVSLLTVFFFLPVLSITKRRRNPSTMIVNLPILTFKTFCSSTLNNWRCSKNLFFQSVFYLKQFSYLHGIWLLSIKLCRFQVSF